MGKILLIEDDGLTTSDLIKEIVETTSQEVKCAYSYSTAIAFWKRYENEINCIILDLNINPLGLDADTIDDYFPICGILVLDEICKGKTPAEKERICSKTIIYSAYLGYLKEMKSKFEFYHCLTLKTKSEDGVRKLLDSVAEIVNKY